MPVFPIVNTVADAQFVVDTGSPHQLVHLHTLVEEEVIVAAVEEPLDGTHLLLRGIVGLFYETQRAMLLHGLADIVEFVLLLARPHVVALVVEPGTHRIARREHLRMALTVSRTAASAHREAHHSAVLLVAHSTVLLFDGRQELLEEEVLV